MGGFGGLGGDDNGAFFIFLILILLLASTFGGYGYGEYSAPVTTKR